MLESFDTKFKLLKSNWDWDSTALISAQTCKTKRAKTLQSSIKRCYI